MMGMGKRVSCQVCGAGLVERSWSAGLLQNVCEACAQRIVDCKHESGDQRQRYDADGVGYRVWQCDVCSCEWLDPY